MECLIQYLDDLEDLVYAVALVTERIRHFVKFLLLTIIAVAIPVSGVLLALAAPPLALATVFMAFSVLLYRAATGKFGRQTAG